MIKVNQKEEKRKKRKKENRKKEKKEKRKEILDRFARLLAGHNEKSTRPVALLFNALKTYLAG